MADKITPEHRSWNMSRIKGRNTAPELQVRSIVHRLGFRFSLRRNDLPGRPDIVLPAPTSCNIRQRLFLAPAWKLRQCGFAEDPTRILAKKLDSNVARDRKNAAALRVLGWHVIVVWECELENKAKLRRKMIRALKSFNASD